MSDLNNILEGEDAPVEAVEAPQESEQPVAETPEVEQDEQGRSTPKGEEGAPPAQEDKAEAGLKAALTAERQKRQDIESRYAQDIETLRREMESLKAPKEPEAPPPTLWEDEQGWQQHFGTQVTQTAVEQAAQQSRLQTSELLMMQNAEDFAQIKQDLVNFVGQNPSVNAEVANSPHPWQAAYKAYKNHQTMQELGTTDLSEIEAKLREKIMAELQEQKPAKPTIPQSLADAQSARGVGQEPAQNLSIEDILGG
jgi:hypothetical protein